MFDHVTGIIISNRLVIDEFQLVWVYVDRLEVQELKKNKTQMNINGKLQRENIPDNFRTISGRTRRLLV
jgi:hypothetical protein